MEIIEYENQDKQKKYRDKSVWGYTLGLIGSSISAMLCSFFVFGFLLFSNMLKTILNFLFTEVFIDDFIPFFVTGEEIYKYTTQFLILIMVIMIVGCIMSFVGTFMCWKKPSIAYGVIMILGGVLSLIPIVVPGILIIIGGSLNIFSKIRNSQ